MMKIVSFAMAAFVGLSLAASPAGYAATDQQNVVDEARITVSHLRSDKEFGSAPELIHRARAVLIVPNLVKAGFFLGGEGGDGVMLARTPGGTWSNPAFYTLASASFGLQIGIQSAEVVMIIQTDKALRALEQDQFKFGAQAGLAVVTLGTGAQMATSTALTSADIIVWSSSSGAYAGITLEGSLVKPRESYNTAYYGHPVSAAEILSGHAGPVPGAATLKSAL